MQKRFTWVCFNCRTTARSTSYYHSGPRCRSCQSKTKVMPLSWEAPRKRDIKSWKKEHQNCLSKRDEREYYRKIDEILSSK